MHNPFTLEGKSILVTGASSGIGRAIAIECSKMGAKLIITGRDETRLNDTYSNLVGNDHVQIIADLSNEANIATLCDKTSKLEGIVHCAGFTTPIPFQFITKEKLDSIFSINFTSTVLLSQLLLKKKKLSKEASIVFISSISGVWCSYIAGSMYSATKGAINGIVKGMALDLASKNIRVNSINPAMVETSILSDGTLSEEQLKEDRKRYPLKRYGKPEEVAYAAIYLLSDASKWVTGSNLLIDGGYTLL